MIAPGEGARITYLRPKEDDPEWGPRMRFRLTYQGELKASGRDPETGQRDPMAPHKQMLRKAFHGQLKHLWQVNKFLSEHQVDAENPSQLAIPANQVRSPGYYWGRGQHLERMPLSEAVANMYRE